MALDGDIQILGDLDLAGSSLTPSVAGNAHELDAGGGFDGAREVGQEHECAFENRDEVNGAVRKVGADLPAHLAYAALDLFRREENARDQSHRLVGGSVMKASTSGADVNVRGSGFSG